MLEEPKEISEESEEISALKRYIKSKTVPGEGAAAAGGWSLRKNADSKKFIELVNAAFEGHFNPFDGNTYKESDISRVIGNDEQVAHKFVLMIKLFDLGNITSPDDQSKADWAKSKNIQLNAGAIKAFEKEFHNDPAYKKQNMDNIKAGKTLFQADVEKVRLATLSPMERLRDYIADHLYEINWLENKKTQTENFFEVVYNEGKQPDVSKFYNLVKAVSKDSGGVEINPFDNLTRSYIELGAWLGSQQLALGFMAIAENLGIAEVATPSFKIKKIMVDAVTSKLSGDKQNSMTEDDVAKLRGSSLNDESGFSHIKKEMGQGQLFMIPNQEKIKQLEEPNTYIESGGFGGGVKKQYSPNAHVV